MKKVKVLYIAGEGRSGSTLLGRMLGEIPEFVMCGETIVLWSNNWGISPLQDACACGARLDDCELWGAVLKETELTDTSREKIVRASTSIFQRRQISSLIEVLFPGKGIVPEKILSTKIVEFYQSIARQTGSGIVVDTSKTATLPLILCRLDEIDLRVVQLVRDSRGVAFSWTKKVVRTGVGKSSVSMRQFSPIHSAIRWTLSHFIIPKLDKRGCPVLRIRYEDLVAQPRETLKEILDFSGEIPSFESLDFVTSNAVRLEPGHSLLGNPNRTERGWIPLRMDDAWRTQMPTFSKLVTTALSFPLLLRFGYARKRQHADPTAGTD